MSASDGSGASIVEFVGVVGTGEIAGSATAAAMPALVCKWVKFKALNDNAGRVFIGIASGLTKPDNATDATTGLCLSPNEETDWLPAPKGNMNGFRRICDNAGDDLTYIALS
jgi:hypothetical protein